MKNEEIKELFEAHNKAIKAELNAGLEILGFKMDEIMKKQDLTNGRVNRLEKYTTITRWAHKNPILCIVLCFVLITGGVALANIIGVDNLIKLIK